MNTATDPMAQLRDQANQLYWTSDDTVEQLASRLGMSRRSVYSAVKPLPAGVTCTQCGGVLAFANRTGRAANLAGCPACGVEVDVGTAPPAEAGAGAAGSTSEAVDSGPLTDADGRPTVRAVPGPQNMWEQIREDLGAVEPERAAKIGGAAALGVALGAAAVKAIKKRS